MEGVYCTIGDILRSLLPKGTRQDAKKPSWQRAPIWAPDVFAVAATIAQQSSCYVEPRIALSRNIRESEAKRERAREAKAVGRRWARGTAVPLRVQSFWSVLTESMDALICCGAGRGQRWKKAVLALLAIADEACSGVGYDPAADDGLANFVWSELIQQRYGRTALQLPHSLTHLVPADVACVLPKASTPEVGSTLRSLSHNLALLPGLGVVQAEWYISGRFTPNAASGSAGTALSEHSLNLLLVPFPYVIHATDFAVARRPESGVDGYFSVKQNWLKSGGRSVSVSQFAKFVIDLIAVAEQDVGEIHGVVFPEGALDPRLAIGLAKKLARRKEHIEFLACGTLRNAQGEKRNEAVILRLEDGDIVNTFVQSKHHRWRLNARQVRQYQLGNVLNPEHIWWEDIAVHDRQIQFGVNRHDAVIAALVCEDLARYDPVLPVITAVGPTLVIALLMDGPQLEARWSGRYATVLAEDPGSSVLTLTSLGMIERSLPPGHQIRRVVGLWKDRESAATELVLPPGHQGIVLTVTSRAAEQITLDRRTDGGNVVEYRLGGIRAARLQTPPKWLERRSASA